MATKTSHRVSTQSTPLVTRTKMVWGALVGAMLVVGGGLTLLNGGSPGGAVNGLALTPLAQTTGATSLESVFNTRQTLDTQRWQAIVIHDSGRPVGTPESVRASHKAMGLNGLGYHFLVGNGAGMDAGAIHVGYRWLDQTPGAHVAGVNGDAYNAASVGICLIGDGDRRSFDESQLRSAARLVATVADRLDIPTSAVLLHSELAETSSPGRLFPRAAFLELVESFRD